MAKIDKWKIEKGLQKALAIEFVKDYCIKNKLSLEKLQNERFEVSYNECGFMHPSNIKPLGLTNDKETMPKTTLMIIFEDDCLRIEETEYTREFLSI